MTFGRFYGHFAAAYGTIWLVLLLVALVTQANIQTGSFGLIGFPIMALIYAFFRHNSDGPDTSAGRDAGELDALRRRIARLEHVERDEHGL